MARRRRERMSEGKKNIIAGLIQEYDIKSAEDIQEALKDLLGRTIQEMMETELDEHLGYDEYERSDNPDYRNGVKHKKLRSSYGEIPIDVPQDRDGDFEPQIVQKRKKDISAIEQKIIAMSAKGMTTRQISDIIEDIYERMQAVTKKWHDRYPNAMKRWEENWDVISPMFKFSADVRKVMYTTNAIESLNSVLRG